MAAQQTTNLNLDIYDPATYTTTYVRDWINSLTHTQGSNMTKLDAAIGTIINYQTPKRIDITGDGTTTNFTVYHNHNTITPFAVVYDAANKQMFPEIVPVNVSSLSVRYIYPLAIGAKNYVVVL